MGYIKEPKGVDFIIQSKPLNNVEREAISKFIKDYKAKHSAQTRISNNKSSANKKTLA